MPAFIDSDPINQKALALKTLLLLFNNMASLQPFWKVRFLIVRPATPIRVAIVMARSPEPYRRVIVALTAIYGYVLKREVCRSCAPYEWGS
ncbi:hypothetical protein ACSAZL_10430 [Methanosarcina sp. T3]|uniref:hypothetical protein n=1 Tax=Methanosarcina sp. T3 TaxID=3439062 RepID=UPI003F87524F